MEIIKDSCTVWVCTDCMLEHATGNDMRNPDVPFDRPPLALLAGEDLALGLVAEEHADDCPVWLGDPNRSDVPVPAAECECECEHDTFSWRACQGCGSPLGGDRHAMTIFFKRL